MCMWCGEEDKQLLITEIIKELDRFLLYPSEGDTFRMITWIQGVVRGACDKHRAPLAALMAYLRWWFVYDRQVPGSHWMAQDRMGLCSSCVQMKHDFTFSDLPRCRRCVFEVVCSGISISDERAHECYPIGHPERRMKSIICNHMEMAWVLMDGCLVRHGLRLHPDQLRINPRISF